MVELKKNIIIKFYNKLKVKYSLSHFFCVFQFFLSLTFFVFFEFCDFFLVLGNWDGLDLPPVSSAV